MPKLMRLQLVYDKKTGPIPVGHSRFYVDFVQHEGGPTTITGTNVKRLKLANLGPKARAVHEDEVNRVVAELAAQPYKPWVQVRDEQPEPSRPRARARPRAARRSAQAGATS